MDFCNSSCIVLLIHTTTSINPLISMKHISGSEFRQFSVWRSVDTSVRENSEKLSSLLRTVVIGPTKRLITFQRCCVCMWEWLRGMCHTHKFKAAPPAGTHRLIRQARLCSLLKSGVNICAGGKRVVLLSSQALPGRDRPWVATQMCRRCVYVFACGLTACRLCSFSRRV